MISKKMTCDRCGAEIPCWANYIITENSARIALWGMGQPRSNDGQRFDLCPECFEQFINWLEGEQC